MAALDCAQACELVFGGELIRDDRELVTLLGPHVFVCSEAGEPTWRVAGFALCAPGTGRKYVDGRLVPADAAEPDYDDYGPTPARCAASDLLPQPV